MWLKKKDGQVYLAEVESKWINGKSVQKHIRYIGKEVNGKAVISLSSKDLQIDSATHSVGNHNTSRVDAV